MVPITGPSLIYIYIYIDIKYSPWGEYTLRLIGRLLMPLLLPVTRSVSASISFMMAAKSINFWPLQWRNSPYSKNKQGLYFFIIIWFPLPSANKYFMSALQDFFIISGCWGKNISGNLTILSFGRNVLLPPFPSFFLSFSLDFHSPFNQSLLVPYQ